jgi:PadR family transcriptional regulator PadR
VDTSWRESPVGPPRKYYRLSQAGHTELAEMARSWRDLSATLEGLLPAGSLR